MVSEALFGKTEHSTTSQTVETGLKTFVLDIDDGVIKTDYTVQIVSLEDPDCWMFGVVTAKSGTSVTVSVFKVSDIIGTFDDWSLQVIAGPFAGLPASQTLAFSTNSAAMPSVGDVLSWTIETGKAFYDNSTVYVAAVNDPTDFFYATVVSYNSGTGAIKLVVNRASGSGTNALWALSMIDVTQSFFTEVGNVNYTIKSSDKVVALTTALTAGRTWTLPLAASVPTGYTLILTDMTGSITLANTIHVARSGGNFVNGQTLLQVGVYPYFLLFLTSDGTSNWTVNSASYGSFPFNATFSEDIVVGDTVHTTGLAVDANATVGGTLETRGGLKTSTVAGLASLTKTTGTLVWVTDLGAKAGLVVYDGSAWVRLTDGFEIDNTDAAANVFVLSNGTVIRINGLTANRARHLKNSQAYAGAKIRIINIDNASNVNVNDDAGALIKTLAPNEWGDFMHVGSAWVQTGHGTL